MVKLFHGLQRLILFPSYVLPRGETPLEVKGKLEHFHIDTEAGTTEAFLLRAPGAGKRPAVLYAHGNGELAEQWIPVFGALRDHGLHVLLPEYPGYGRSSGSPSEAHILRDFVRFHDRLAADPEVDETRIVFVGRSLGGGVVGALSRERKPRALVLLNTFTSITEIAEKLFVPRAAVRDRFETLQVVRALSVPTLVIHGKRDGIIPFAHAERLAEACGARLVTRDGGHNDCFPDSRVLIALLMDFFHEIGLFDGHPT